MAPQERDRAIRGAASLIDEALAEPGCLTYAWTFDAFDAGRIHVFEAWESERALADHFRAPSYRKMLAHLRGVGIGGARTHKYRVDRDAPVYDATGTPRADFPGD